MRRRDGLREAGSQGKQPCAPRCLHSAISIGSASVDEMFSLVADVERYPEFLPFCQGHAIRSRRVRDDVELLTTDMTVAHLMFRETFRSFVTLDRANARILIAAADGPLRRLDGRWIFRDGNSGGCEVGFSMSYELTSRSLAVVMGPTLKAAFSNF